MTEAPKPLTEEELKLLESTNGVTGLSTVDCRRLLANSFRLRQLVIDAAKLLTPPSTLTSEEARKAYEEFKAESGSLVAALWGGCPQYRCDSLRPVGPARFRHAM